MIKSIKNMLCLILIILGLTSHAYSYEGAASFLKRGMSARALGLGGAYTALVNDPSAVYWNPAGIANGLGFSMQISDLKDAQFYSNISDVNYPQMAMTLSPRWKLFTTVTMGIGFGFSGYYVNGIEQYDEQSSYLGDLNYSEMAYYFSYAFGVDNVQMGISYKYLQQDFGIVQRESSIAQNLKGADIGIRYSPFRFLILAITINDKIEVGSKEYTAKAVTSSLAFNFTQLSIATDYSISDISFDRIRSGLEYRIGNEMQYAFRIGVRDIPVRDGNERLSDIIELNAKLALGFGYQYDIGRNGRAIIFDIGVQQEMKPSLVSPFSRIIATTITLK